MVLKKNIYDDYTFKILTFGKIINVKKT